MIAVGSSVPIRTSFFTATSAFPDRFDRERITLSLQTSLFIAWYHPAFTENEPKPHWCVVIQRKLPSGSAQSQAI
jgi:hypothetical protein